MCPFKKFSLCTHGYDEEKKLLPHFPVSRIDKYNNIYMFLWPETKIQQMLPINLFIDTFGHRLFDSATFFGLFVAVYFYSWVIWGNFLAIEQRIKIIQKIIQSENINSTKNCFVTFVKIWNCTSKPINQAGTYSNYIQRENYGLWSVWIIYIIALCFHYIQKSAWRSSDIQFHWRQLDYFHLRIYYILAFSVLIF